MKVLIDTWGWISLYNKREKKHEEVKNWYRGFRKQRGIIYTTDYVLDETFNTITKANTTNKFIHSRASALRKSNLHSVIFNAKNAGDAKKEFF